MILAIVFVALTFVALAFVLLPLFRRRARGAARADYDIAVYKDQLREVERETAAGALDAAAAQSARLEIERRLLAAASAETTTASAALPRAAAWRWSAVIALLLVPATALIYLERGAPGLPGAPFAERAAQNETRDSDIADLIGQVEQRLAENPDDLRGWVLLARAYVRLGRMDDALAAQAKVTDLFDQEPDLAEDAAENAAAFGELLVQAAGGEVTTQARTAFAKALNYDDRNARARYFLALAKMQDGDPKAAVADWKALIAEYTAEGRAPPPWLEALKDRIAEIEAMRAPTPESAP